jgi:hypothetical protein
VANIYDIYTDPIGRILKKRRQNCNRNKRRNGKVTNDHIFPIDIGGCNDYFHDLNP